MHSLRNLKYFCCFHKSVTFAVALVRGFYGVFERGNIQVSVTYDQDLFKPLVAGRMSFGLKRFIEYDETSLCEKKYTADTLRAELEERLSTLPRPEGELISILKVMQKVTGSDAWIEGDDPGMVSVSEEGKVLGLINTVRVITQATFYARASNMKPEFLPMVTTELLYRLLEWTYWYQSLTEMENSHAITDAAPLAAIILEALREDEGSDGDVLTVFLYIGHDTNISRVASLFGLRFDLDPPYFTSPRASGLYAPAPPGSAMHFAHDLEAQSVEMSFVYPVLISGEGHLYWDGRVSTVGMKKRNSPTEALGSDQRMRRRRLSVFGKEDGDKGLELLENRIMKNMIKFEGAIDCFEKASQLPSWPQKSHSSASTSIGVVEPNIAF